MGVWCEITIHNSSEGVFRPGQAVTGLVRYSVNPETKYKDIVLSLIGDGECTFSTIESDLNNFSKSLTRTGTEIYIIRNFSMMRDNQAVTVSEGAYECPFEFILPKNIPSSCKSPENSKTTYEICYRIMMNFIKANVYSTNKKFDREFIVHGDVDPVAADRPIIYGLVKPLFTFFSKPDYKIKLETEIPKSYLSPGEDVQLKINILNPTSVKIIAVKAIVIRKITLNSDCGYTDVTTENIAESSFLIPTEYNEGQSMVGNIAMMPEFYSIQRSKIIKVDYFVKMELILPIPHRNASMEMPIAIGVSTNTGLDDDLGAPPPSYDKIMGESKKA